MFHTLLIIIITLQVTLAFTCGIEFYYFDDHFTPSCKVVTTLQGLHKLPQPCDNLVTTLQSCSKVATTYLVIFIWEGFLYKEELSLYEVMNFTLSDYPI